MLIIDILKRIYRDQRFRNHPKNRKKAHLKSDHPLGRNFYKGMAEDAVNILLAAAAYNFKRTMKAL